MKALTISDITSEWLSQALGRPIQDFTAVPLEEGYTSAVYRLFLSASQAEESGANSVILKTSADAPAAKILADRFHAAEKEQYFYNKIANHIQIRSPVCYHSSTEQFALLLEDMKDWQAIDETTGAGRAQTLAAMRTLGQLHLTSCHDFNLVKPFDVAFRAAVDDWQSFILDELKSSEESAAILLLRHYAVHCLNFLHLFDKQMQVFSHMDYRLANIRFMGDELCLLDWGEYCLAPVGFDIASFLTSSVSTHQRRSIEQEALVTYCRELSGARSATAISEETLFDAYRLCLPACYYLPALVKSRGQLIEGEQLKAQCLAAIEDHLPWLQAKFGC